MTIQGFTQADFDVFTIPGLESRMAALIRHVRPKLTDLGGQVKPLLSSLCGEEMHPHVARHARRTINAPNDTWVAWANSRKGYKAYPHFQVGLFSSHLFIQFAIIYESNHKETFADHAEKQLTKLRNEIPGHFFWSLDHTLPNSTLHKDMGKKDFQQLFDKLRNVKKAEVLCGLELRRDDPSVADGNKLFALIEDTFTKLVPLYRLAF